MPPRRFRKGELTIHRYPDRPCPLDHQTWSGDYARVKTFTANEVQSFINSHSPDYLKLFCEHTPAMQRFLETSEYRGLLYRIIATLTTHFQNGREEEDFD